MDSKFTIVKINGSDATTKSPPLISEDNCKNLKKPTKFHKPKNISFVDPSSLPFKPVLSDEETRDLELGNSFFYSFFFQTKPLLVDVWVADIDARSSSTFLRYI